MISLQNFNFLSSVNDIQHLPIHQGIEVAFAGRSNAGKSSAINALTGRRRLAFVSKMPGRTQQINFFYLKPALYLVDLPGYGYAKVPDSIREHWQSLVSDYLQTRSMLLGLVLIMDIRHPLTPLDIQMLDWFVPTGKVVHILLTKADKLSKLQANNVLFSVSEFINKTYANVSVQIFSSLTLLGIQEARITLDQWFNESIEK